MDINQIKKHKTIALLAPSFAAEFEYPLIIGQLKEIGFDKIVELTFGAKMINRDYHKILKNSKELVISSVCPGITSFIRQKYPEFVENLIKVDSPMIATGKICKKIYPKHKTCFISPCNFKKQEAKGNIDYVIDYQELRKLLDKEGRAVGNYKCPAQFDKFYNDYTKIYPLSGGLSKTAHLKSVLKKGQEKVIGGILEVEKFLKEYKDNKHQHIKFLDVTFCKGGCIGGPFLTSKNLKEKKKKLMKYLAIAKKEKIPCQDLGLIKRAKGIKFTKNKI